MSGSELKTRAHRAARWLIEYKRNSFSILNCVGDVAQDLQEHGYWMILDKTIKPHSQMYTTHEGIIKFARSQGWEE